MGGVACPRARHPPRRGDLPDPRLLRPSAPRRLAPTLDSERHIEDGPRRAALADRRKTSSREPLEEHATPGLCCTRSLRDEPSHPAAEHESGQTDDRERDEVPTAANHDVPRRDEDDDGCYEPPVGSWGAAESRCTRTAPYTNRRTRDGNPAHIPRPRTARRIRAERRSSPSPRTSRRQRRVRCRDALQFCTAFGEMAVPKRALPRHEVHNERTLTGLPVPGQVSMCADRPVAVHPVEYFDAQVKARATIRSRDPAREQGEKPAQDRKNRRLPTDPSTSRNRRLFRWRCGPAAHPWITM